MRMRTWKSSSSGSIWISEARESIAWARMLFTSSMTGASSASSRRWLTSSPRSSSRPRPMRTAVSTRRSRSWLRANLHAQEPAGNARPSTSLASGSSGSRPTARYPPSTVAQATTPLSAHHSAGSPVASITAATASVSAGQSLPSSMGMPSCCDSAGNRLSSDSAPNRTRMLPMRPPNCC